MLAHVPVKDNETSAWLINKGETRARCHGNVCVCVCVSNSEEELRQKELLQSVGWNSCGEVAALLTGADSWCAFPGRSQSVLGDRFQSSRRKSSSDFLE